MNSWLPQMPIFCKVRENFRNSLISRIPNYHESSQGIIFHSDFKF